MRLYVLFPITSPVIQKYLINVFFYPPIAQSDFIIKVNVEAKTFLINLGCNKLVRRNYS